mgnify:CR=1 FL=1
MPERNPPIFSISKKYSRTIEVEDWYIWSLGKFARRKYDPIFELYSDALNRGMMGIGNCQLKLLFLEVLIQAEVQS